MTIFLYGPDEYRRAQRKKYYIAEFKKKYSGLSVGYFDLAEANALEELKIFARSESLFETKKLAVLENLYEAQEKKAQEALLPFVDKKSTNSGESSRTTHSESGRTIVLCSERNKPNKVLQFLLEKPAVVEGFENLSGPEWERFIKLESKKLGMALDDAATQFLAQVYKANTWGLVTELQKMSNIKNGSASRGAGLASTTISRKDLEMLGLEITPDYFPTIQSLKNYDISRRLWALEKLFAIHDPAPKTFNVLASLWREKVPAMAEYDLKIKSGKMDYEEALVDLVL